MEIIAVSNQKGGVGKTTVAVHLAIALQEEGKKVLFVDFDPQGNASDTLLMFGASSNISASGLFNTVVEAINAEQGITLVPADSALADIERADTSVLSTLKDNMERVGNSFDYCVIDSPPTLGLRMTAALLVANHVLAPIELEQYSIKGITEMLKTIFGVKAKWNPKLNFIGMLPNRYNSRSPAQQETLSNLVASHAHLMIAAKIGIRSSIPEALGEGIPVWKLRKTSARKAGVEFKEAFALIYEKMGGLK